MIKGMNVLEQTILTFSDKDEVMFILGLFCVCLIFYALIQFMDVFWKFCPVVDAKITAVNISDKDENTKYILDFTYEWNGQIYEGKTKEKIAVVSPKRSNYEFGMHYLVRRNPITKKCKSKEEIDYDQFAVMHFLLAFIYAVSLTIATMSLLIWMKDHMAGENAVMIPTKTYNRIIPTVVIIAFGSYGMLHIGQAIAGFINYYVVSSGYKMGQYTPIEAVLKGYNMIIKRTRRGIVVKYSPYYEYGNEGNKHIFASKYSRRKLDLSRIGTRCTIYQNVNNNHMIDRCPGNQELKNAKACLCIGFIVILFSFTMLYNSGYFK